MNKKITEIVLLTSRMGPDSSVNHKRDLAHQYSRVANEIGIDMDFHAANRELDGYVVEVDRLLDYKDALIDNIESIDNERTQLLDAVAELAKHIPHAVVFECQHPEAISMERWLSEHAVGDYDFIEALNAVIVTFTEQGDQTLFKLRFGV